MSASDAQVGWYRLQASLALKDQVDAMRELRDRLSVEPSGFDGSRWIGRYEDNWGSGR